MRIFHVLEDKGNSGIFVQEVPFIEVARAFYGMRTPPESIFGVEIAGSEWPGTVWRVDPQDAVDITPEQVTAVVAGSCSCDFSGANAWAGCRCGAFEKEKQQT